MSSLGRYLRTGAAWAALICLALATPGGLRAQEREPIERARASFQAGATAYAAGEYLAAIQALDTALSLTPLPAIAFSLAQAERRQYFIDRDARHLERAITLYRRYLDQVPSGGRRADAVEALSQLEPLQAARSSGAAAAGPAGSAPGAPAGEGAGLRPTRLLITTEAPGARIALDGAPPAPAPLIREVEPGAHQVEVAAPGFFSERREVTAVKGELIPVMLGLRERPSRVVISAPRGAELYLDGVFVSHAGDQPVTLALPSGPHHLAVGQKGHRVLQRPLALDRGKSESVQVTLEPTRQRAAARALFVGSGVALGAGAVLGVLALHSQGRAEDFLAKSAKGNVDAAELDSYRDMVRARDRYRVASVVSLAAVAGLLVTGAFLHEIDQPDREELHRRPASGPGEPRATTTARLRLRPGPGLLGAGVAARF